MESTSGQQLEHKSEVDQPFWNMTSRDVAMLLQWKLHLTNKHYYRRQKQRKQQEYVILQALKLSLWKKQMNVNKCQRRKDFIQKVIRSHGSSRTTLGLLQLLQITMILFLSMIAIVAVTDAAAASSSSIATVSYFDQSWGTRPHSIHSKLSFAPKTQNESLTRNKEDKRTTQDSTIMKPSSSSSKQQRSNKQIHFDSSCTTTICSSSSCSQDYNKSRMMDGVYPKEEYNNNAEFRSFFRTEEDDDHHVQHAFDQYITSKAGTTILHNRNSIHNSIRSALLRVQPIQRQLKQQPEQRMDFDQDEMLCLLQSQQQHPQTRLISKRKVQYPFHGGAGAGDAAAAVTMSHNNNMEKKLGTTIATKPTRPLAFWESMICGAISRSVAQTVMHPANTMKTLLQNGAVGSGSSSSYTKTVIELLHPTQFRTLTRGAGANFILSVPHVSR